MTEKEILEQYLAVSEQLALLRIEQANLTNEIIYLDNILVTLRYDHKRLCPNQYTEKGRLKKFNSLLVQR